MNTTMLTPLKAGELNRRAVLWELNEILDLLKNQDLVSDDPRLGLPGFTEGWTTALEQVDKLITSRIEEYR